MKWLRNCEKLHLLILNFLFFLISKRTQEFYYLEQINLSHAFLLYTIKLAASLYIFYVRQYVGFDVTTSLYWLH